SGTHLRCQIERGLHAPFQVREQPAEVVCDLFEAVRHKLKASVCEACLLDLSSDDSAYSSRKARTAQGKPVERRGRKATGLRIVRSITIAGLPGCTTRTCRFYVQRWWRMNSMWLPVVARSAAASEGAVMYRDYRRPTRGS